MGDAWKRLDLRGGGLQQANLSLAAALRRRSTAYLWWLAFPLGAHRAYLRERLGALGFAALSVAAAVAALLDAGALAIAIAVAEAVWAAIDLIWIDRRVITLNKRLRMAAYLRPGPGAPPGFRGRLTDPGPPPADSERS
jgi:hypothetical protein